MTYGDLESAFGPYSPSAVACTVTPEFILGLVEDQSVNAFVPGSISEEPILKTMLKLLQSRKTYLDRVHSSVVLESVEELDQLCKRFCPHNLKHYYSYFPQGEKCHRPSLGSHDSAPELWGEPSEY